MSQRKPRRQWLCGVVATLRQGFGKWAHDTVNREFFNRETMSQCIKDGYFLLKSMSYIATDVLYRFDLKCRKRQETHINSGFGLRQKATKLKSN